MTAEEKFNEYFNTFPRYGTYLAEDWKKEIIKISKEYARLKCQELLEIVAEKAKVEEKWEDYYVNKDSILNAVDLNSFIS